MCLLLIDFQGEDDTGLPLYIIKQSEIAKLNLSNPSTSQNIAMYLYLNSYIFKIFVFHHQIPGALIRSM